MAGRARRGAPAVSRPPPACLLRHAPPDWLARDRSFGVLADNDEGAGSVARFWGFQTAERLAAFSQASRAALLAAAQAAAVDHVLAGLDIDLELHTLRALATPLWAVLERGSAAAVSAAVESTLTSCEACHFELLDASALAAAGARLKLLTGNGRPAAHMAAVLRPNGTAVHIASGATLNLPREEHCLAWACARRTVVQEVLVLLAIPISIAAPEALQNEVAYVEGACRSLADPRLRAKTAPGLAKPVKRALRAAPWPRAPAAAAGEKTCGGCSRSCARDCFSRRQWEAPAARRRCSACVAADGASTSAASSAAPAAGDGDAISFAAFAAEFEAAVAEGLPQLSAERIYGGELLRVTIPDEVCAGGHKSWEITLRNLYTKWPDARAGPPLRARALQLLTPYAAGRMSAGLGSKDDNEAPFTLLAKPGSYLADTLRSGLSSSPLVYLPFPELDPAARDAAASGPLLALILGRHMDFQQHRQNGTANILLHPSGESTPAEQASMFAAAARALGEQRSPPQLTPGRYDVGGVNCSVEPLPRASSGNVMLRLRFSDNAAVGRLVCAAFARRLAAALGCALASLVVVPLTNTTLLASRADSLLGCCALGDFALFADMPPREREQHLSSQPLRPAFWEGTRSDGLLAWEEYPEYGGRMTPERLTGPPAPVPATAAEVAELLRIFKQQPR